MEATENCPVIPEIINDEWLGALPESDCEIVYIVYGDICTIPEIVEKVKAAGKMAIVHMDLIVGLSSKEISVDFLKKYTKVDGIISMKPAMIKRANDVGLFTIQRFYLMVRLKQKFCLRLPPFAYYFLWTYSVFRKMVFIHSKIALN